MYVSQHHRLFFPVTKEARDALYSQILNSYEMVMEQQERQHPTPGHAKQKKKKKQKGR